MSHNYYRGPGSNAKPAIEYLKSVGAISEESAISLNDVPSEEFRRLIEVTAQTSGFIGINPEGRYWLKMKSYRAAITLVVISMVLFFALFFTMVYFSMSSFFDTFSIEDIFGTPEYIEQVREDLNNTDAFKEEIERSLEESKEEMKLTIE